MGFCMKLTRHLPRFSPDWKCPLNLTWHTDGLVTHFSGRVKRSAAGVVWDTGSGSSNGSTRS